MDQKVEVKGFSDRTGTKLLISCFPIKSTGFDLVTLKAELKWNLTRKMMTMMMIYILRGMGLLAKRDSPSEITLNPLRTIQMVFSFQVPKKILLLIFALLTNTYSKYINLLINHRNEIFKIQQPVQILMDHEGLNAIDHESLKRHLHKQFECFPIIFN